MVCGCVHLLLQILPLRSGCAIADRAEVREVTPPPLRRGAQPRTAGPVRPPPRGRVRDVRRFAPNDQRDIGCRSRTAHLGHQGSIGRPTTAAVTPPPPVGPRPSRGEQPRCLQQTSRRARVAESRARSVSSGPDRRPHSVSDSRPGGRRATHRGPVRLAEQRPHRRRHHPSHPAVRRRSAIPARDARLTARAHGERAHCLSRALAIPSVMKATTRSRSRARRGLRLRSGRAHPAGGVAIRHVDSSSP